MPPRAPILAIGRSRGLFVFVNTEFAERLEEHTRRLCASLKIEEEVKPGRGRAKVRLRQIQRPPIQGDEMAYFVALHEIGHIVIGLRATRLEREALAWEWALKNAIIEPHYSTRQRICANLVRYLFRAKENDWGFPDEDSAFWRLLRWWEVDDGTQDSDGLRQLRDRDRGRSWSACSGDVQ